MSDWVILRTKGRHTLELAASLDKSGFEVWTPSKALGRRGAKGVVEIAAPLMPTYVFAKSSRITDLMLLANTPRKPQPDFSLFHYMRRVPLIADRELAPLRTEEARAVPKRRRRCFARNDVVRIEDGPFAGMSGVVQDERGNYTMVLFDRTSVKIATFLLLPTVLEPPQSTARAA